MNIVLNDMVRSHYSSSAISKYKNALIVEKPKTLHFEMFFKLILNHFWRD